MEIPRDVLDIPAGPDGNGFMVEGVYCHYTVGSDGRLYGRKDSVVFLDPEDLEYEKKLPA